MDAYKYLPITDAYEAKHGSALAVIAVCNLMVSYLSQMRRPFPGSAARGLEAVYDYRHGLNTVGDLHSASKSIEAHLNRDIVSTSDSSPEECIAIAVRAVLVLYQNPEWMDGASETLSNFLDVCGVFEKDHEAFVRVLLEEFSGSPVLPVLHKPPNIQ